MSDIDVQPEALYATDTGEPILTREHAQQVREEWTEKHPPIPGLRWQISFNLHGDPVAYRLIVEHGWEDAYAPSRAAAPAHAGKGSGIDQDDANRLGALAYQGWFGALPESVREASDATWDDVPEPFREPLRQAAVLVWQHAENAGFHQALLRTLPAGQLGAAGELENMRDLIYAQAITDTLSAPGQKPTPPDQITVNLKWLRDEMTARVQELRRQAAVDAKRERDAEWHR
jgi:hypothetical protein